MELRDRHLRVRARLALELLEDRATPATLDASSLALPELAATGAVAGDRVNVVMASTTNSAADAARLAATPLAAGVTSLGFGIYRVSLAPGADLGAAVAYYGGVQGVLTAAPDALIQIQNTPNDTYYAGYLYGMQKIGAPTAWDTTTGSSSFVVAVIDTGIDYNHPDLAANVWTNPNEIAGNGVDDDGNGFIDDIRGWDFANDDADPMDDNGHGTHVSGTIGAVGNNSRGVVGVNWSVQIMALKFLNSQGSGYTSDAVAALNYAVAEGVKVSNNSWGGGGSDSTLASAIGRAQSAGHIFVAAAGNSGVNIDNSASYPASYIKSYDNVVTVAATDSSDKLASFSNYGANSVTLAAPGVDIASTYPSNRYAYMSGTSMATPHVTGAIALYWGANPDASYSDVIAKLKDSVDVISGLSGKVSTGGRLNVAKMFESTSPPTVAPGPKVTSATYSGSSGTQLDTLTVTFDRDVDATSFTSDDIASFTGPGGAISTSYTISPTTGTSRTFTITFAPQTAAGGYSMVLGPNILDTSGNPMNQNGDGTAGDSASDQYTATGNLVLTVNNTYSSGTLSLAIRDRTTTTSTITVGDDVKISDLNVKVSITHSYDSDLVITLTSPPVNGVSKTITLFNRRGGSGDNLTGTTFDDEASTSIANGTAPFSGTYRPEQALSAFDGLSAAGVWTLKVSDKGNRDTGTLTNWALVVTGTTGGTGGMGVRSLGTLDGVLADLDDSHAMLAAEPISVSAGPASAGSGGCSSATTPARDGDAPAGGGFMAYLPGESARRDYDAPPASSEAEGGDAPAAPEPRTTTAEEQLDSALAALYFPPADSSADGSFEEFGE